MMLESKLIELHTEGIADSVLVVGGAEVRTVDD